MRKLIVALVLLTACSEVTLDDTGAAKRACGQIGEIVSRASTLTDAEIRSELLPIFERVGGGIRQEGDTEELRWALEQLLSRAVNADTTEAEMERAVIDVGIACQHVND